MKISEIKKGQTFSLNGETYLFLRFNRTRMNQKGGRPVVAYKEGNAEYSYISLQAFSNATITA